MIQQRRTDRPVPAKTDVVGKPGLKEVGIEGRRKSRRSVQLLLVTAAVGKEEFVAGAPVLVDSERHRGVSNGDNGTKDEVILKSVQGSREIGMGLQKGKHFFCDRAQICDHVTGERLSACHAVDNCRGRRVEDLTF